MSNVKRLYLINLTSGMLFYTPIFTLFLLQRDLEIGFILASQAVFSIAMLLAEFPTGILADKYGQKLSIQLGLLLDALSMLSLLFLSNNLGLIMFFAVRGVSVAFRSGSVEAMFYETYINENKSRDGYTKAFGRFNSYDLLGFIVATALSSLAILLFGSRAYPILIVLTAFSTLTALLMTHKLKDYVDRKSAKQLKPLTHLKKSLSTVKNTRIVLALTIFGFLTLNGEYFLRQSYQVRFEEVAVPAVFLGLAMAGGKLINFFALRYSYLLEKKLTLDKILLLITLTTALFYLILGASTSPYIVLFSFVALMGIFSTQSPIVSDYLNERIDSNQRSTVLSSISFLQNLVEIGVRLMLAVSVGIVGLAPTYILQAVYLALGGLIGYWYLNRCGCVHRVKSHKEYADELIIT